MAELFKRSNCIEVGGGETPKHPEFLQCDIRDIPSVDYVCNAWDLPKYVENNSIFYIYSRHFLEHLTFYDARKTLEAWYSILSTDGYCAIIVPNISYHIDQWKRGEEDLAILGFWGKQRETDKGRIWDIHKSGYSISLLQTMASETGFASVEQVKDLPKNLHVRLYK